ncbi:mediator of RNA polymerase II transcription subunit 30-like [Liolophura sinensis]|uniref:mediator of RNA polymerase II transcription subunit 30-like n=1 Tax=Liolophura sinensis TaxID=3198878 RepID=UPI003158368A
MASFNQPCLVGQAAYTPVQQQQQQQQQQQVPVSQQQQVTPQTAGVAVQPPAGSQQPQGTPAPKEPNYALLCRAGQEFVHEIVNKTNELFQVLKVMQLPNGYTQQTTLPVFKERKAKVDELLQTINTAFRKLKLMYDTVNEYTSSLENGPIETLIPLDGIEIDDRGKETEIYRFVSEEHKDVYEQVCQKNRQLKEVIDQMRTVIWEINTMITMRKS